MIGQTILVCEQEISFSNDFGCGMNAHFTTTFEVKDIEEGEKIAEFFMRPENRGAIKPQRIMKAGYGVIYKEYTDFKE